MLKTKLASSALVLAGGLFASGAMANPDDPTRGSGDAMHKSQQSQQAQQSQYGEQSQHGQQSKQVSFDKLDQNGDGYVSQSEFEDSEVQQVDHNMLDTDNDGRINRTEFAAFEQISQDQSQQPGTQTNPDYPTDDTFQSTDPTRPTDPTRDPGASDSDY